VVSIDGMLDAHEVSARARVEALREQAVRVAAELGEAETVLEHVAITRATLAMVVAAGDGVAPAAGGQAAPAVAGLPAVHVPVWRESMGVGQLPIGYQGVWRAIVAGDGPIRAKQLALMLGLEATPAKVEGLRSKLKRLAARGWLVESAGVFAAATSIATAPAGGS
jgi:hypothetical protein